ncbi:hypothetical protein Bpfe_031338 [Biomphalaria pfeifferi]|uniref:Uncharacterized protein n=1 Tax=Biomphalaria pfeifferi TaxID=112525 RepID=A0AAD8APP9_BIOPF|nr:hypothetical protein Bpfe_031338 [Biomphalaria pfeifferi]
MNAQRTRDLFLRQRKPIAAFARLNHQKPRAKSLLDRMITVANRSLRNLFDIFADIIKDDRLPFLIFGNFPFKNLGTEFVSLAGNENLRPIVRRIVFQERHKSQNAFLARHRNFDGSAVLPEFEIPKLPPFRENRHI